MIRIKQIIREPKTNKIIKMYMRDTFGSIQVFESKAKAREWIEFIKECRLTSQNIEYKIVGK